MPYPENAFNLRINEISEHIYRQNCNPKIWIIQFIFLLPRHSSDVFYNMYNRRKKDRFYFFIIVIVKISIPRLYYWRSNILENINQGHVFWKRRNNILTSFFKQLIVNEPMKTYHWMMGNRSTMIFFYHS